jgi:hypothetical protein
MEWVTHPGDSWFVTLTYREEDVPKTPGKVPTLRKQRFRKFLNNARRDIGPFRYYAVGEYGEMSMRPHYHLAVFPGRSFDIEKFTARWKLGYTSAYPLSKERAGYLAQYATKKLTKDTDERLEVDMEPEFRVSSKKPALGEAFIHLVVRQYRENDAAKRILEERGDIERTWRFGKSVYPIPEYTLSRIREDLGIPVTHADRLNNENYWRYHYTEEDYAEKNPEVAAIEDEKWAKKKTHNLLRFSTKRV